MPLIRPVSVTYPASPGPCATLAPKGRPSLHVSVASTRTGQDAPAPVAQRVVGVAIFALHPADAPPAPPLPPFPAPPAPPLPAPPETPPRAVAPALPVVPPPETPAVAPAL